jgi:hypothetical protein
MSKAIVPPPEASSAEVVIEGSPTAVDAQKKGVPSLPGKASAHGSTAKVEPPVDAQPVGIPALKSKLVPVGTVAVKVAVVLTQTLSATCGAYVKFTGHWARALCCKPHAKNSKVKRSKLFFMESRSYE